MLENAIVAMLTAMANYNACVRLGNESAMYIALTAFTAMRDLIIESGYEMQVTYATDANAKHELIQSVKFNDTVAKFVKSGIFDKFKLDENGIYQFS